MPILWLQGPENDASSCAYGPDGVKAADLADPHKYDLSTMKWDHVRVFLSVNGYISEPLINDILRELAPNRGRSQDAAIQVTCKPVGISDVVSTLLQNFGIQRQSAAQQEQQRAGLITPDQGRVAGVGLRFGLAGCEANEDEAIRWLCHMDHKFRPTKPEEDWKSDLQLLREVGAPGVGKSTNLRLVWARLRRRIDAVKRSQQQRDKELWQHWLQLGIVELEKRLQSWGEEPWVFVLDMSNMSVLLPAEQELPSLNQLAIRMLYAAVGDRDYPTYDSFFSKLTSISPALPKQLAPLHVLQLVQQAAGVAVDTPTIAVWAFDEVNAVQPSERDLVGVDGTRVTFLQRQLSQAVVARWVAWRESKKGRLNLLPVFITASTRGSATSLHNTASRKAKVGQMRLASANDLSVKQLVVMDLFRRLPWPGKSPRPAMPGPDNSLSDLSDAEKQQLLRCCPAAVTEVLRWVGSSYRLVEYAVAALTGCWDGTDLNAGNIHMCFQEDYDACKVIRILANRMVKEHWDKYVVPGSLRHELLTKVLAYSVTGMTVTRTQELVRGAQPVGVQDVEADGMVVLSDPGNMFTLFDCRNTLSDSAYSEGAAAALSELQDNIPQQQQHPASTSASVQRMQAPVQTGVTEQAAYGDPAAGNDDTSCEQPDAVEMVMVMAPLMVAALQCQLESQCNKEPYIGLPLLDDLADDWQTRESSDAATLALRLQLYRQVFGFNSILLQQLHPGFHGTMCDVRVYLPTEGHQITKHPNKVGVDKFKETVAEATTSAGWVHVGPGNSGPGDSWLVLFECDSEGVLSGKKVVLHLQSKSSLSTGTFDMQLLETEVQKVYLLQDNTLQAFVLISDKLPGRALKRRLEQPDEQLKLSPRKHPRRGVVWQIHSTRSATAAFYGGSVAVVIVAGEEQQSLRGATELVRRSKQRIAQVARPGGA